MNELAIMAATIAAGFIRDTDPTKRPSDTKIAQASVSIARKIIEEIKATRETPPPPVPTRIPGPGVSRSGG